MANRRDNRRARKKRHRASAAHEAMKTLKTMAAVVGVSASSVWETRAHGLVVGLTVRLGPGRFARWTPHKGFSVGP